MHEKTVMTITSETGECFELIERMIDETKLFKHPHFEVYFEGERIAHYTVWMNTRKQTMDEALANFFDAVRKHTLKLWGL